jgi:hypothetical protein
VLIGVVAARVVEQPLDVGDGDLVTQALAN